MSRQQHPAIPDCKHGIQPRFCLPCHKERIAVLEGLLSKCLPYLAVAAAGKDSDHKYTNGLIDKIEEALHEHHSQAH